VRARLAVAAGTVQRLAGRPFPVACRACRACGECGHPIEPGAEHYPHRAGRTLGDVGWCDCDHPTHPQCCPTCPTAVRP
jgi:hypothetical protein